MTVEPQGDRRRSSGEKRRSPRHLVELPVELIEGKRSRVLKTVDVSRHGLFIATDEPPLERYLVQLSIKLASGPLPATAFVSRTVGARGGRPAGVGVQFFALSAASKQRWDTFIFDLGGMAPPAPSALADRVPDGATFLIKLKSTERLLEFYERNIKNGGLYMATPLIKEAGAEIALVVIHPETEQELIVTGCVSRVCRDAPKGMEIKLDVTAESRAKFLEFVTTGFGPESIDIEPPLRQQIEQLPTVTEDDIDTEDLSIDIIVDDSAIEESEQFDWDEVPDSDGVLTFDIVEYDDYTEEAVTADVNPSEDLDRSAPEIDLAPPPRRETLDIPVELSGEGGTMDLGFLREPVPRGQTMVPPSTAAIYELSQQRARARVECTGCRESLGEFEIGGIDGPLGLLASKRAYWCPRDQRFVSAVRLNPSADRRAMFETLGESVKLQPVMLELAFQVAELASSPRCPYCSGNVRVDAHVKALLTAIAELGRRRSTDLGELPCPHCEETTLRVRLLRE